MPNDMTQAGGGLILDGDLPDLPELSGDFGLPAAQATMSLSRKQKAAIIVRLLLAEGAELKLQDLPDELQTELIRQMSDMRFVDRATLKSVIDEFVNEIEDIALAFPGGVEGALSILDGTISASTATRIRNMSGLKLIGDPWSVVSGLDPDQLLTVLEQESIEVAAVLLSKLKVSVAAELLGRLPGARARAITYAVSQTAEIAPDTVEKIGQTLASQLGARPPKAFDSAPVERVGAILNFSQAATREDVLDGLEQTDSAFAREVRKAIFTFANIPQRLDPRDVPRVTKDIEPDILVTALAAATGALAETSEFILGAMSKRMAEQLRDEISELGTVKASEGEAAMGQVVARIREMEAAGEVLLLADDDEDE